MNAYPDTSFLCSLYRKGLILNVATAVHLRAKAFLTFDDRQRRLACHAGLEVPL